MSEMSVVVIDDDPDVIVIEDPSGTPGPPGTKLTFTQTFSVASASWSIAHNFNTKFVNVEVVEIGGSDQRKIGVVSYPDANHVLIEWFSPETGIARLNA